MATLLASFMDRRMFGPYLAAKGLLGEAVEIGTHRGLFAYEFLCSWQGERLHCVDHWKKDYDSMDSAGSGDRGQDLLAASALLKFFSDRVRIIRNDSTHYATKIGSGSIDFVYIDGCHQRDAVRADLCAWWPKVKPGGVLAGHDYICPGEVDGGWGRFVQPEVNALADSVELPVYVVAEPTGLPWSWILEKPRGAT